MSTWTTTWGNFNLRPTTSAPRTPGIHLSGIIRPLAIKLGEFDEADEDLNALIRRYASDGMQGAGHDPTLCRIAAGLAWEDWLCHQIPGLVYHPGEQCRDGIYMTPDGLEFTIPGIWVHEFKFTWKSAAKPVPRYWDWQCASYAHAVSGMGPVLGTVLHVYSVNGTYKSGFQPCFCSHTRLWDQKEKEDVWRMMYRNRDLAVPES